MSVCNNLQWYKKLTMYLVPVLSVLCVGFLIWAVVLTILHFTPAQKPASEHVRTVCTRGTIRPSCVIPIGYAVDPSGGIVSNSFGGGVSLPVQLLGSTFDGSMYDWDSTAHEISGAAKFSITRLEGIANGITAITWGADRQDGLGLANRTTVEQCTGYGPIRKLSDSTDLTCGWETGVIYASDRSNEDFQSYVLMPFIHIYKIEMEDGKPVKLRMWEALIDDESKSLLYTEQLKNNIGATALFGEGEAFASLSDSNMYEPSSDMYQVQYMEMMYDSSQGMDVPTSDLWSDDQVMYDSLKKTFPIPQ